MVIDKVFPVHALNKYLWSRIKGEGILTETNYSGLVPIVPVEEIPELLQIIDAQPGIGSFPFLVYSWSRINNGVNWWMKTHNIAYSIRSTDDEAMGKLINLFEKEFQDYEAAARRVNDFVVANGTALQKRYRFTHINVQVLGAQMPAGSEQGSSEALVTIAASYVENTQ